MTSLTPESRAILDAGTAGDDGLDDVTRARMKRRLLAQVAVGGAAATTATVAAAETGAATAAAGAGGLTLLTKVGLAVSFVAATSVGAVFVSTSSAPSPPAKTPTEAPADVRAEAPPTKVASPPPAPVVAPVDHAAEPEAPAAESPRRPLPAVESPAPASPSSLAEETALLRRAQRELQEGDPDRALELLDAEGARYEGGVLQEEREAARVLALCHAGRLEEGRAAQQRFVAAHPQSPHRRRVLAACR